MQNSKQNRRLARATWQEKRHYKLYKTGKIWAVAGISLLFSGIMLTAHPMTVHAAAQPDDATAEKTDTVKTDKGIVLQSSKQDAAKDAAAPKTDTTSTDTQAAAAQPSSQPAKTAAKQDAAALAAQQSAADTGKDKAAVADAAKADTTSTAKSAVTADPAKDAADPAATTKSGTADDQAVKAETSGTQEPAAKADSAKTDVSQPADQSQVKPGDTKQSAQQQNSTAAKPAPKALFKAQVDAVSAIPAQSSAKVTLPLPTDGDANTYHVGYGNTYVANKSNNITGSFTMTAHAGDVFTITFPHASDNYSVWKFSTITPLIGGTGTTETGKIINDSVTVKDTFTSDGIVTQTFTLAVKDNSAGQSTPISDVGDSKNQITYTVNGAAQTPVTIKQTVTPTFAIGKVERLYPISEDSANDEKDPEKAARDKANALTAVTTGTDYVYQLAINESDGVRDDTSRSARVNSAVNYGSIVTVPTPEGFVLNPGLTADLNKAATSTQTDQTTITQPGGIGTPIIINVPKGSGSQSWQGTPAYRIAGQYETATTTTPQTLTAAAAPSISQKIDDQGTTLTAAGTPWTENLLAKGTGSDLTLKGATVVTGNGSTTPQTLVLADPQDTGIAMNYLNGFTFDYERAVAAKNDAQLTINVPDGFDATALQLPSEQVNTQAYLKDTTSYGYAVTLADGTTEKGTLPAGSTITPTDHSPIRTIVLTPNFLAAGATSTLITTKPLDGLFLKGTLAKNYDNGDPVKVGDQLKTSFEITVDGQTLTGEPNVQTVADVQATAYGYKYQSSTDPGKGINSYISFEQSGGHAHTTEFIKKPILYYVLPPEAEDNLSTQKMDSFQGAAVTQKKLPDGRTLVTIDYTNSDKPFDTSIGTNENNVLNLINTPDAMTGDYPIQMYIVSPYTQIDKKTKITDPALINAGVSADAINFYSDIWSIKTAEIATAVSLAQGNEDADPTSKGNSEIHKGVAQSFFTNLMNSTKNPKANSFEVINLPQAGDDQGSGYTFSLTGPAVVPSTYNTRDPLNSTVLYSTKRATLDSQSGTFDRSGYVPAEDVASDWSQVKSILIDVGTMPDLAQTGRILLPGEDANISQDANKTAYLQTGFYAGGANALVSGKGVAAQITLANTEPDTGTETPDSLNITYVDDDNSEAQVGKTTTLPGKIGGNGTYTVVVPAGYALAKGQDPSVPYTFTTGNDDLKIHLIHELGYDKAATTRTITYIVDDGGAQAPAAKSQTVTWKVATDAATGTKIATAQSGYYAVTSPTVAGYTPDQVTVAQEGLGAKALADLSNEAVTVHYTANDDSLKVTYVDDDNGEAQVGDATTLTGKTNGTGSYTAVVPTGYVLALKQAGVVNYKFTPGDDDFQIHLRHELGYDQAATTRTITYIVDGGGVQAPATKTQTVTWKVAIDPATDTKIATAQSGYYAVTSPTVAGYTPNQVTVAQEGLGAKPVGDLSNEAVTVHYTANADSLKVTYVDDDNGEAQVGDATTLTGKTNGTGTYTAVVPAGYVLAPNQLGKVDYKFTPGNDDFQIHLSHELGADTTTTTRTINYVVDGGGAQAPAVKSQTVTWKVATDAATGAKIATAQNGYYAVTSPTLAGYTADKLTVAQEGLGAKPVTDLSNEAVTVHYTANADSLKVTYVDDDNGEKQVGNATTLNGKIDGTGSYTAVVPTGYVLAPNQPGVVSYKFTTGDDDFQIHLAHNIDDVTPNQPGKLDLTRTVTQTVQYVDNTGLTMAPDKKDTVTFTRTATVDAVTGATTYTNWTATDTTFDAKVSPVIQGYTVSEATVPAVTGLTPTSSNQVVVVVYTPINSGNPDNGNPDNGNPNNGNPNNGNPNNGNSNPGNPGTPTGPNGLPNTNSSNPGTPTGTTNTNTGNPGTPTGTTGLPNTNTSNPGNPGLPSTGVDNPGTSQNTTTGLPNTNSDTTGNSTTGNPGLPSTGTTGNSAQTATGSQTAQQTGSSQSKALPQTGDKQNFSLAWIGALLISMFGFAEKKRRSNR